jgi:LuxR family transcriptional regulator, maltose regulon positive regulatory protein
VLVSHQNGQAIALQRLNEHHSDPGGGLLNRNELVESKLHPPWARPGIVPRTALVDRLLASHAAPVVCVVAPPGYGKTTLLAQWAKRKGTRVGWVSVDRRDNDPAVLLTYLAVALDRIEPIDPSLFHALAAPGAVAATVMARFAAAVSAMTQPVTLVLDHVELLHNPQCLDAVAELMARLPSGSQLALASRTRPLLPVAWLRTQGRVVEVGVGELAMDQREASLLLQGAGVRLGDADVTTLVQRTEGWPVALYMAALALQAGAPHDDGFAGFAGDDRLVADYLRSELLARLSQREVVFLTRTAVLDRMCGPLCDAVLDTKGSTRVLESLAGANLLLLPLDRRRQWYRYHHLFGELLRAELQRREPELVPRLHVRAAAWCEANGLPQTAIDHAQAAGDTDRVARLVATLTQPAYAAGRVHTARRWLAWFEDQGLIERYPQVAVQGAWVQALVGGQRRPSAGPTRPNAACSRPRCRTAARWQVSWHCCARCCAATACSECGPTRRPPWPGWVPATRGGRRRCCWRESPTFWTARSTGPTRSWPTRSRSPPTPVRRPPPRQPWPNAPSWRCSVATGPRRRRWRSEHLKSCGRGTWTTTQ